MKSTTLRIMCVAAVLLIPITLATKAISRPLDTQTDREKPPGLAAKITMLDGTVRPVRLEGVGCSFSLCSRVVTKGKSEKGSLVTTPFDTIAAIRDITRDHASYVLRNGTQLRLSLVPDFRVLYIPNQTGGTEKIDLATIKSIEFTSGAK